MSAESSGRPLLLPQNRKLRHLRGIYLRNLTFTRTRGHTIDDAALNKSPGKLETLRENSQLHHALSSESLRPAFQARRRSTTLSSASPLSRQKKLEYAVESRVADVFFSLHYEGEVDPIYTSEVGERATNFNFRFFELSDLGPSVTRSPGFMVKVWAKHRQSWGLLVEEQFDLRSLNFLTTLQNTQFPPNCLIFYLIDGFYTLELSSKVSLPKQAPSLPTSSYNALMRLSNLESSIQDALATQEKLTSQINDIIASHPAGDVPEAEEKADLATKFLSQQRRNVRYAHKKRAELQASISARRAAIESGRATQAKAMSDVENADDKLDDSKISHQKTQEGIHGQRRRICEDLADIFQIVPTPGGPPLSFQICGISLPNTTFDSTLAKTGAAEDTLSAALGCVAVLTDALQYYLGVPLPYPIRAFGSRSSIRDDISMLPDPQRDFPLYVPRGGSSAQFRFDYGWFLLNKNIETLCGAQGLKVVDIRHTLPNLKYLLYVCSAGTDEVPERKRGGVRGLWAGRLKSRGVSLADDASSADGSRRGSADSDVLSRQREELRRAIKENGDGGGMAASIGPPPAHSMPFALPFDERETKLTLRTKGLRENIVK